MDQIVLDIEAGELSAELRRRGIPADTRVHAVVELPPSELPPLATLAQSGGAFDWLADEPDLYSEADLLPRPG